MADDYSFKPVHYQLKPKKDQKPEDMKNVAPGEHVIQFLLGYSAALFIKTLPDGMVMKMMMN